MLNKKDVSQAVGVNVALSAPMAAAFALWSAMYENRARWIGAEIKSMGLASGICGEIARMVTAEMQVKLTGGVRAEYLSGQIAHVIRLLRNQKLEYGLSRGGMVMKPFVHDGKIGVDFVGADSLYPVRFDASGNITAVVFADVRRVDDWWYTRLEYHQMLNGGFYLVQNHLFKSSSADVLGAPVKFEQAPIEEWRGIKPNTGENGEGVDYIQNVTAPLYGYFRFPSPNNIDPTSPLGVAAFSNAQTPNGGVELIKQADVLYSNLMWEFESGKRAIYVDTTAFDKGSDGKPMLPDRRLYRTLDRTTNIGDRGNLFDGWSPEFRDAAINNGLNAVLKRIEFACRLAYGTLSDPQTVDKTATEVLASQQRSYVTVTSTQEALQSAIDGLLYAMGVWTDLYGLAPSGNVSATYEWDDSVITNREAQFAQDTQALNHGTMSKLEWRMRTYREDEATARKMLALVDDERQRQMESEAKFFPSGV